LLKDKSVICRASIGIALVDYESLDSEALLKKGDLAMYSANGEGGSRYALL